MSVIANTTVISNFASIDRLELLHHLYTTLYISTEVYAEIQQGAFEGYGFNTPWPPFFTLIRWRLGEAAETHLQSIHFQG